MACSPPVRRRSRSGRCARILLATGGEPAAPLDDTFIHFQYAKSFATLEPFRYSPGAAPAPGATSLLWPLLLAFPYASACAPSTLLWAAWLAVVHRAGSAGARDANGGAEDHQPDFRDRRLRQWCSLSADTSWFAASGMEVVPLAWLLMRSVRKAAEWGEAPKVRDSTYRASFCCWPGSAQRCARGEPWPRLLIAATVAARAAGVRRCWALAALPAIFLPSLVNWLFTGQATTTTAQVKWLPLSPYQHGAALFASIPSEPRHAVRHAARRTDLECGLLTDRDPLAIVVLRSGAADHGPSAQAPLRAPALDCAGARHVDSNDLRQLLWNRLRYLWPFAAAWFVGAAALVDGVTELLARLNPRFSVGAWPARRSARRWSRRPPAVYVRRRRRECRRHPQAAGGARSLGTRLACAGCTHRRQRTTGRSPTSRGGMSSTSSGLTTRGEARYWAAGAGSRFEHYERLPAGQRPTHFIVYPEWFALPALGRRLSDRAARARSHHPRG
jgi:hypothetical protein